MPDEKPFQLDPKEFKTGNFLVDKAIEGAVKALNKADWNKDGKSDVGQYAPFVFRILPILVEVSKLIDWDKLLSKVLKSDVIKNDTLVAAKVDEIKVIVGEADGLAAPETC